MHRQMSKKLIKNITLFIGSFLVTGVIFAFFSLNASAANMTLTLDTVSEPNGALGALEVLMMLAFITLIPSMLLLMTSFTRIIIVLSFLRNALGTQQSPPNVILVGLALFLTLFIMTPTLQDVSTNAYEPYKSGIITSEQALENAQKPIKTFMIKQTGLSELNLFVSISKQQLPENFSPQNLEQVQALGLEILVPSFVTSELKRAFTMGFLIFVPFLIIDIVVSSALMSMGMVMLPPSMIALPFKILTFILVDGWTLTIETLVKSFY